MWVDRDNDVEYLFMQEVRDKKRAAQGARHNSGRRGGGTKGVRSVKTTADWLKANDKIAYKNYIKAGDIKMSNVYEDINNIPSTAELKLKDYDTAHTIATAAKRYHTSIKMAEHWNMSNGSVYGVYNKYGVEYPRKPRKTTINNEKNKLPQGTPWTPEQAKDKKKETNKLAYEHRRILEQSKQLEEQEKLEEQERIDEEMLSPQNWAKREAINEAINEADIKEAAAAAIRKPTIDDEETDNFSIKWNKREAVGSDIQDRMVDYISILKSNKKYCVKLIITEINDDDKAKN